MGKSSLLTKTKFKYFVGNISGTIYKLDENMSIIPCGRDFSAILVNKHTLPLLFNNYWEARAKSLKVKDYVKRVRNANKN